MPQFELKHQWQQPTNNKVNSNTRRNKAKVKQVSKAIKSAKVYGRKLGIQYDKKLNQNNASWFSL